MDKAEYLKMKELEKEDWWFRAKRRLVLHFLRNFNGEKYLDVGAGTGQNTLAFSEVKDIFPIDISKIALKYLSENNSNVVGGDITKLPYKDNSFDGAIMLDVLEHIEDHENVMKELSRIIKKKGKLIITVPAHKFLWSYHDLALHHKRRYGKKEFIDVVENNGFIIEKISYWDMFLFPVAIIGRKIKSFLGSNGSDIRKVPEPFNSMLFNMMRLENLMIKKGLNLPAGVSLFAIASRK